MALCRGFIREQTVGNGRGRSVRIRWTCATCGKVSSRSYVISCRATYKDALTHEAIRVENGESRDDRD